MYTLDDGPSYLTKGPVNFEKGLTGINNAMVKRLFILNWRRMVWGFLNASTDKNMKDCSREKAEAAPNKISVYGHIDMNFFVTYVGTHFCSLFKHFRYTLYKALGVSPYVCPV